MPRNRSRPAACDVCGQAYTTTANRQRYCSPSCKEAARRQQRRLGRPVGEAHPRAKLTTSQVREARAQYRGRNPGAPSIRDLAAQYGVGYSTMWDVLRGHHWAHVE